MASRRVGLRGRMAVGVAVVVAATGLTLVSAPPASAAWLSNYEGLADFNGDGCQDIVWRIHSDSPHPQEGQLWLDVGSCTRDGDGFGGRYQIGSGWDGYTIAGFGDWDSDGYLDVVARDPNGDLWLYPCEGARGFTQPRVQIGDGWNGYTFAGVADWDRDGNQDIVAKDYWGYLWLYPGDSVRGYSSQRRMQIGNGWNGYTFAGVADWDSDGNQDIVARDRNGYLWLYPGEGVRGYSSQQRVLIGNGWNGYTFVGIGDWDRDLHQDIVARDFNSEPVHYLWLYPGEGVRGYSGQPRVRLNWY
ncbi:FG-GAP repeat domain-containing protein [Pseudofrankia saprophytica]|nr:VCBS repeat-containing protein [Pseudofrankia saprophytica]